MEQTRARVQAVKATVATTDAEKVTQDAIGALVTEAKRLLETSVLDSNSVAARSLRELCEKD